MYIRASDSACVRNKVGIKLNARGTHVGAKDFLLLNVCFKELYRNYWASILTVLVSSLDLAGGTARLRIAATAVLGCGLLAN
jgi:hypothetical protein